MKQFPFREMIKTLKTYLADDVPVVTRISRSEKGDPFLILVGTLLSLRTKDETTDFVMEKLMERATTPQEILAIPLDELQQILYPVGFYRNKSTVLNNVSRIILEKYRRQSP